MPINTQYDEDAVIKAIAISLENFYANLITKLDEINIRKILKRKNPYLFRAKAMCSASDIVEAILSAYISSSEETIFGNVFFEPIALAASSGQKSLTEGIDIRIDKDDVIYAIAVKSGTCVFNADSRKRQEQNFLSASKLAQQAKKRFVPIIGYGYGKKKGSKDSSKFYFEYAGKDFWFEITGDENFYLKLVNFMGNLPEQYSDQFKISYQKAMNRLIKEFTNEFCLDDGTINWKKIIKFNCEN